MMIFLSLDGEALLDDFISPLKQDSVVVQRFWISGPNWSCLILVSKISSIWFLLCTFLIW